VVTRTITTNLTGVFCTLIHFLWYGRFFLLFEKPCCTHSRILQFFVLEWEWWWMFLDKVLIQNHIPLKWNYMWMSSLTVAYLSASGARFHFVVSRYKPLMYLFKQNLDINTVQFCWSPLTQHSQCVMKPSNN
jgi:hypothetical protein